jgi:DNA-binding NarL/FixJ family response regulator
MRNRVVEQETELAQAGDADPDEQLLIRDLVNQIDTENEAHTLYELDGNRQEAILDVEIDGVRYLLLRSQSVSARPQTVLSPREQEIARMVGKGYPNKTIAAVLDISTWTVCTYLRRIFAKLNVNSRAAMIARLADEGLLRDQPRHIEAAPPRGR